MWPPYLSVIAVTMLPVSNPDGDIISYILGYGVLGIGAVLLMLRIIVPGKSVDEAVDRGRADCRAVSGAGEADGSVTGQAACAARVL
jgi:hypothetical protein